MRRRLLFIVLIPLCLHSGCRNAEVVIPSPYVFPDANTAPDSILMEARLLKKKAKVGSADDRALAAIYMGTYFARTSAYRHSRKEFSVALADSLLFSSPVLKSRIYSGLGNAAKNLSEYPEALEMFSDALKNAGSDSALSAGIHANIAQVFQLQNDLPQAVIHLNLARAFSGPRTDNAAYLMVLHTLANVYGMSGKTDSALILDAEGLAIAARIHAPGSRSSILDNMANCYMHTGRPDSARWYLLQSLRIDSAEGNVKQMSDTWLSLGYLEQMQGRPAAAEALIKHGMRLADSCGYRNGVLESWMNLAALYEEEGDFKKALEATSRYHAVRDSVASDRKNAAVAEWKAVFETARKEDELRVQSLQLRQQRQTTWAISIGSVLLISGLYYAYRRNHIRKERRFRESMFAREQEAAREIVMAEEAERKRIAADLHDGIGQTLTAAWLNLQAIQPKLQMLEAEDANLLGTTMQLVGESCAEIRQISHNMMPAMLLHQGLIPAVQELAGRLHDAKLDVSLSLDVGASPVEKGTELIVYRIIQECVNNVVRHAHATAVYISLSADESGLDLMIEDNGVGLKDEPLEARQGLGMQNIRSRVQYLHGSVEWSGAPGEGGTVVAIHIPTHHDATN